MGSKAPATTTQTNSVQLTPDQEAISKLGLGYAQNYAANPLTMPDLSGTNGSVVGFDPLETQGQDMAVSQAQGQMTDLAKQAADTNSFLMNPALLSPDSNPYLKQQGDAITQQATDNLTRNILPALRSGSVVSGGFNSGGNTRYGLAQGNAVGQTNQDVGNSLASLYGGAYQNGLQTLLSAIQQNPSVMKGLLQPANVVAGVGDQRRQLGQAQVDQDTANATAQANQQWMMQQLPFLQAQQLYSLMNSMPGATGVSTVTGSTPSTGGVSGALGGGASGAALGSMLFPGVGTAVGGGLGALLGAFA